MKDSPGIISQRVWSTKELITAIIITISIVSSAWAIYARFLFIEYHVQNNKVELNNSLDVLEERMDKRYDRNKAENIEQWKRLNKLEENHKNEEK